MDRIKIVSERERAEFSLGNGHVIEVSLERGRLKIRHDALGSVLKIIPMVSNEVLVDVERLD